MIVAAAASVLSAAVEVVQAIVPAIGRACDTGDWQMNTIGAVVGAILAWVTYRWIRPAATDRLR